MRLRVIWGQTYEFGVGRLFYQLDAPDAEFTRLSPVALLIASL